MPLFRSRRGQRPRIAPELDDDALAKVLKVLDAPPAPGLIELHIAQVQRALDEPGKDWDRRSHRLSVLAERTGDTHLPQAWVSRAPRTADALLLKAQVDLRHGQRGGALADPQATIGLCHRVAELHPDDPAPWVVLLGALRLMRRPSQEVFPVWEEIMARDTWNREAFLHMTGYLAAEECGSHMQLLDFVDAARARMPADAPAIGAELVSVVRRQHRSAASGSGDLADSLMAREQWAHPPVSTLLERAHQEWTRPGFLRHAAALADLNLLAYALIQADRLTAAADAFQAIGTTVTAWPWRLDGDPLERFQLWRERALR
ncbi:hypothetical protein [Streptomyces sp. ODS28]|uniref:hypothetical protein n=1 Tax=Streptomyces sp. ODS28 TaxID=3136688 RepID=UPI0031E640D9